MTDVNINKFIADCGVCSRRQADILIKEGKVFINGRKARRGDRVIETDQVMLDGQQIKPTAKHSYILLYKPKGISCSTHPDEPDNVIRYLNLPQRVFPVGRLDKDSEGLLLLTDNGNIVNKILRAENLHEKEYIVKVNKEITEDFLQKMSAGVPVLNTITLPCQVIHEDANTFRIVLTQGLNRQIRRMCSYLGYRVEKLARIRIMHLTTERLEYGKWRHLSQEESNQLLI
jgi:23S rRNA pseudouridine2604 synthase